MKRSCGAKTLAVPAPVWVVCSYDQEGRANAMTASWAGICCSRPPELAVALREATYSHGNIKRRGAFTVCIPSEEHMKEADYLGLESGRDQDKLAAAGLTAQPAAQVDAPFVQEFPVVIECRLAHTFELGLHTLFVGEILDVRAEEEVLGGKGYPTVERVRPLLFDPGEQRYYGTGRFLAEAFSIGKKDLAKGGRGS